MAKRIERIDIAQNDVFEGIKESAKKAEMEVDLLAKALKLVNQGIDDVKGKAKGMQSNPIPTDVKGIKEQNQLQKDALALAKERERLEKLKIQTAQQSTKAEADAIRLQTLKNRELEKSEARLRKEAKAQADANSAYTKASNRLNELRKSYKDLAVAGNENSTEARKMRREIDSLDKTLKRVDGNVGQFQRNVGNYSSAFSKLSGALGTLGIGIGAGALFSGATRTIVEFDQAIADLVSITGAGGKDLEFFKKQAVDLGVTVKGGASAVIEAYKLIGSAKPELLSNAQALDAVTQSAITLSKASGMDLPASATALTDAMNQFGASAEEADKFINVLGAGAKFGSAEIPQITEALLRFGAVAKTSNVNIEESTALIEALAERGLKGADAGTALRNVMLKLSAPDALPIEAQKRMQGLGISFDKLRDTSIPFSERLEELKPLLNDNAALVKVFGTENAVAATNLLTSTDRIKELNAQVTGTDTAFEQAQQRTQTLSQAFVEFKGTFEKLILDFYNGSGAGTGFANALGFITKNLPTIISGLAKLTAGFIAFKTVTAIANTDFKALISNFTKFKTEAGEGTSKMSGFGNALKGIGWSVAIGLAVELGMKLWDIASGAEAARDAMRKYEAQLKTSNEASQGKINELQEREKQRIAELNELLKDKRISQAQYVKLVEQAKNTTESELRNNKKLANDRKQRFKDLKAELLELREKAELEKGSQKGAEAFIKLQSRASEIARELNISGNKTYGILSSDADDIQVLAQLEANIGGINKRLVNYSQALKDISDSEKDFIDKTKDSTITTNAKTKAIEKQTKAVTELQDKVKRSRDTEIEFQNLENEMLNDQIQSAQEQQLNNIADAGTYTIDVLNQLIAKQKELRLAMINSEFADNVAGGMNLDLAEAKRNKAIQDLDEETLKSRKTMLSELETAQEEFWERERLGNKSKEDKTLEDEKNALDERRRMRKEFVDGVIDEMKRISQEEEKLIDDRIKAEQDLQSNLQAQASAGNISAQQSIVASMQAEKRATLEKQKEQKKQQALDDIKTLYNLINSNISNDDSVGIATTKAIASMGVIKSVAKVFSALSGFAKGTEWRLGDEHKPMFGGVDGHVVRVDSSEAIVKGSLMDKAERAGITSTSELVQLAVSQKLQPNMYAMNDDRLNYVPVAVKQNNDLSELKRELRDIKDTIKNKTEFSIDPYVLNGMVKGIVETQKTGNFSRKNIFK
jgi:TP901 family phage tail tape measure protein